MDRCGVVGMTAMAMGTVGTVSGPGATGSMGVAAGMSWLRSSCSLHSSRSRISSLETSHQRWFTGASGCGGWATSMKHFDGLISV